ncbi:hypothetical protein MC885_004181 [Smutsia gigantea]|nr:hypothetical protein MC885_004181 [Smutsia gigantea]
MQPPPRISAATPAARSVWPLTLEERKEPRRKEGKPRIAGSSMTARATFYKPDRLVVLGQESISQTQALEREQLSGPAVTVVAGLQPRRVYVL